jgi:hypothetical protein
MFKLVVSNLPRSLLIKKKAEKQVNIKFIAILNETSTETLNLLCEMYEKAARVN